MDPVVPFSSPVSNGEYCRELERYLCQKNGGHLVRIVGPAFEQVRGWAELGIPLAIACRGIDRYCARQQAKAKPGMRRRPVRIEFCEHDILGLFDDWRRAVGIVLTAPAIDALEAGPAERKEPLTSHVERVVARLVGRRTPGSAAFEAHVERLLGELDRLSAAARQARGQARAEIVDRLAAFDAELMTVAARELDAPASTDLRREAEAEIAPFAARMAPDVRARALDAAVERLVRESLGLPTVRYG